MGEPTDTAAGRPIPRELQAAFETLARESVGSVLASVEPIAPGLGTRRFYRLRLDGSGPATAIARVGAPEDAALRPPGVPPEPDLEPIRSFLADRGIPVPALYGRLAPEHGSPIELLEDFGDESLEAIALACEPSERGDLYREACALVPRLQALSESPERVPAFARRLDDALFTYKAEQVVTWCLPLALDRPARPSEAQAVRAAFALAADACRSAPRRLAHRDYKAANLHVRVGRARGERLGLIDFQGALLAPPEYDLVCLLRDPHVPLAQEEVRSHADATRPLLPDAPGAEAFGLRFELLTLTRVGKDCGRYLYAAAERNDRRYLRLVPAACHTLRETSARAAAWAPELARLAELLQELPVELPGGGAPRGTACGR